MAAGLIAAGVLLFAVVLIVWLDRDAYRDGDERRTQLLDSFYYATVTLSTTGYGDITPSPRPPGWSTSS